MLINTLAFWRCPQNEIVRLHRTIWSQSSFARYWIKLTSKPNAVHDMLPYCSFFIIPEPGSVRHCRSGGATCTFSALGRCASEARETRSEFAPYGNKPLICCTVC